MILKNKKGILYSLLIILAIVCAPINHVSAAKGTIFTVSPMSEKIVLNPDDNYSSSFSIYIPPKYDNDVKYTVEVAPFYVDENYANDFTNKHDTNNEIIDWITIETPKTGRLKPDDKINIIYTINVPKDAAGGGQYAAILVTVEAWDDDPTDNEKNASDTTTSIKEIKQIAYTIYAEITGDIIRQGEIESINVPGFILSGNISGNSSIRNTGNVHGEAKYKLQVFPLFSDEEIYTNEEKPTDRTILPDRTLYNEISWSGTPAIGIFNVVYTVEFEGVTAQTKKIVIKCPIWLLFIILFAIIALIIWVYLKLNKRRNARKSM